MICALYTLLEKYKGKKIYVWNVNRTSMVLFTKIALRRINIQGFVVLQEEYIGKMYMNRPVISVRQVQQEPDSIVLVADEVPKESVETSLGNKAVFWSNALDINQSLKNKRVMIYGTGNGADKIEKELMEAGIQTELYCVTNRKGSARNKGKRVIEASELDRYKDYAIIISVLTEQNRKDILETLSDYDGYVYVQQIIDEVAYLHLNLFQYINSAILQQKKIYLYGRKNMITDLMEDTLNIYNIKISGYASPMADEEHNIYSIFSLALEDNGIDNKLIVISEILPERLIEARESVELAGFLLENAGYTGLQWYTASKENLLSIYQQKFDALVGMSLIYDQENKAGWKVYGKEEKESIKVIILGGSTSSEVYHCVNWVSRLYYKLRKSNVNVTFYNGAHTADDIVDEILRLLRDGNVLKPDIVISMSGVNNLSYKKSDNQFNENRMLSWAQTLAHSEEFCSGLCCEETLYDFWSRNQKLLKVISEFYGAVFLGFLQPMNITMDNKSLKEKYLYELENVIMGANEFGQFASERKDEFNLMRLFEHQDEMFYDMAHYTNKAHEIIADKVYDKMWPIIQNITEN